MREFRVAPDDWGRWIEETDGHQMVVAGPGTGKTEFLIRRVAHLVESGKAHRNEVAVLAFSRRAAADIRRRVDERLGGSGMPIESATFHSLALRILEHSSGARPIPLTAPEQAALVQRLLGEEEPSSWPVTYRGILHTPAFAIEIADFLMRCSERLLSPDDLSTLAAARADWRGIPGLFARYRSTLADSGRTDYGMLLVSAAEFLETPEGRELAAAYRYIVVDEYQDTSRAQASIARELARPHGNLTVAGDPYQSVYSFRGAELTNIAAFTEEHPESARIILTESFRVPEQILDSALRVVSSGELPGGAGPVEPAPHPGRVDAYVFDQETAEAEWIAAEVDRSIHADGIPADAIAVLVRSKRELLNELSRALSRRSIPHDPPNSRLVDHPAVGVVHDLVTVALLGGPVGAVAPSEIAESDRAMRRILLGPLVTATLGWERHLLRARRKSGASWAEILELEDASLDGLSRLIGRADWAVALPAVDGFWAAWTELPQFGALATAEEARAWRHALSSFAQVLARQAERDPGMSLAGFFRLTEDEGFEPTPLLSFRPQGGRVSLTTLHQSKGLEFDLVFIANAVEGVFPDLRRSRRMLRPELLDPERTTDPEKQHLFQVQEEMRLAYTAMTRARRRVVWTATDAGVDQGERRPSRFLIAAVGVESLDRIGRPEEPERPPVTVGEFETVLRRRLTDPESGPVQRMAAIRVLAESEEWDARRFAGVPASGPDRPILHPPVTLSPSQAETYANCPRRYALERRLRLSDSDSPYAQFGSLVHEVLERAEAAVIDTGDRHAKLEDCLGILEEVWGEADFGSPQLNTAWQSQAEEALRKLYENWPSSGTPIDVETWVEETIAGVRWVGKIDRLEKTDAGLKVVDYKTSRTPATREEAAESIQLGFYAMAAGALHGEEVVAAEMWYPRSRSKGVSTPAFDLEGLPSVRLKMETVTSAILDEEWSPQVSDNCRNCGFRLSCPAWPEGRGAYLP